MRVSVTERHDVSELDLRPTSELAPALVLSWLMKLRYSVLAGQTALILILAYGAGIHLPLAWLAVPLFVTLLSNVLLPSMARRVGARRALGVILAFDVLALTALLALTGGPVNPFSLLYLVQITLSAVVLSRAWTWSLGLLSILGFGFLFFVHVPLPMLEGHHAGEGFSVHLIGMWIAFVTAAILITLLVGKVSETLRAHEEETLRLQSQLSRQEKIASLATLAAGAAHEMGTPLATIAVVAKELEMYAARQSPDPHVAAEAHLIRAEVDRCGRILHGMSAQDAESIGETPTMVQVTDLFHHLCNSFPESQRHSIKMSADAGLKAALPVETTRQVLAALVKNAMDASEAGQPVTLIGDANLGRLRFTVRDSGAGMTPEALGRIAEPFFTTKEQQRGMGLGTFLVRVFAERLGGTLVFDSAVGHGTTAILELPLVAHIVE